MVRSNEVGHHNNEIWLICRELEARLGATPPPSPSDCNTPALLTSRIAQLSAEVDKLKRMLQQREAQSGCLFLVTLGCHDCVIDLRVIFSLGNVYV